MTDILIILERILEILGGVQGLQAGLILLQGVVFGWLKMRDSRTKKQLIQTLDKSEPENDVLLKLANHHQFEFAFKEFRQFLKKKSSKSL